ncbi:hypothetical protein BESB_073940 [Besnoitia besnoiti]|uniref:Uncharacterized protein n=1 Tax=Besnoitia besnoiti TaxID=94643 RepID=A0A2A9MFU6_BESBE|nr:uncharacterized protein BESB_073940 [Besnoitia besnoiti]PFH34242.1 hypothetical protein BESB_073940 [Besnoitia besnoiti]
MHLFSLPSFKQHVAYMQRVSQSADWGLPPVYSPCGPHTASLPDPRPQSSASPPSSWSHPEAGLSRALLQPVPAGAESPVRVCLLEAAPPAAGTQLKAAKQRQCRRVYDEIVSDSSEEEAEEPAAERTAALLPGGRVTSLGDAGDERGKEDIKTAEAEAGKEHSEETGHGGGAPAEKLSAQEREAAQRRQDEGDGGNNGFPAEGRKDRGEETQEAARVETKMDSKTEEVEVNDGAVESRDRIDLSNAGDEEQRKREGRKERSGADRKREVKRGVACSELQPQATGQGSGDVEVQEAAVRNGPRASLDPRDDDEEKGEASEEPMGSGEETIGKTESEGSEQAAKRETDTEPEGMNECNASRRLEEDRRCGTQEGVKKERDNVEDKVAEAEIAPQLKRGAPAVQACVVCNASGDTVDAGTPLAPMPQCPFQCRTWCAESPRSHTSAPYGLRPQEAVSCIPASAGFQSSPSSFAEASPWVDPFDPPPAPSPAELRWLRFVAHFIPSSRLLFLRDFCPRFSWEGLCVPFATVQGESEGSPSRGVAAQGLPAANPSAPSEHEGREQREGADSGEWRETNGEKVARRPQPAQAGVRLLSSPCCAPFAGETSDTEGVSFAAGGTECFPSSLCHRFGGERPPKLSRVGKSGCFSSPAGKARRWIWLSLAKVKVALRVHEFEGVACQEGDVGGRALPDGCSASATEKILNCLPTMTIALAISSAREGERKNFKRTANGTLAESSRMMALPASDPRREGKGSLKIVEAKEDFTCVCYAVVMRVDRRAHKILCLVGGSVAVSSHLLKRIDTIMLGTSGGSAVSSKEKAQGTRTVKHMDVNMSASAMSALALDVSAEEDIHDGVRCRRTQVVARMLSSKAAVRRPARPRAVRQ